MKRRNERIIVILGSGLILLLAAWLLHGQLTARVDSFAKCASEGYPVAESDPPTCNDGRHAFVGPRASPGPSTAPSASLPFELLVDGDSASDYPQRQETITTQADWTRYWRSVHASLASLPPILPVDFTKDNVIAISEGRKMTGGYNLKITGIMAATTGTTVSVTETVPTTTCAVTQATTNRYLIVRTSKLAEPVSFRISTDYRQCH
jgi:hypothetical protein